MKQNKLSTISTTSPIASRNKSLQKFPQPGSFAASPGFRSTFERKNFDIEKDRNFVYQSPRNKNSTVKFKAMTAAKVDYTRPTFRTDLRRTRNSLFSPRSTNTEQPQRKIYNKVANPHEHNESTLLYNF